MKTVTRPHANATYAEHVARARATDKLAYQKVYGAFTCFELSEHIRRVGLSPLHAFYCGTANEAYKLHQLVRAMPPSGGMESYIADLDRRDA